MKSPTRILRYVLLFAFVFFLGSQLVSLKPTDPASQNFSASQAGHSRGGYPYPEGPKTENEKRASVVIDEFRTAWHGYSSRCFGHDEVRPVSGKCSDSRNGWGASIIDALSTAIVMGQIDIVHDILEYIPTINFSRNGRWPKKVNVFETTIRYMGGLISAYDLFNSGLQVDLRIRNRQLIDDLLTQALMIAEKLFIAFDTPTGIPINQVFIELDMKAPGLTETSIAAMGTLTLEWVRLAELSGHTSYLQAIVKSNEYLLKGNLSEGLNPLHSGLLPTWIDVRTGNFTDSWGSWGAGRDSAYEYLLKAWLYDHRRFRSQAERWREAANGTIAHAAAYPTTGTERAAFLMDWGGHDLLKQSDYLAAFAAGNFLLAGSIENTTAYLDFGTDLMNGLRALQLGTTTGIGPEKFSWDTKELPESQKAFFEKEGWYITEPRYSVRPEVLESYYYAYRITGDTKYQDWAWELFQSILKACKTNYGLSSIDDVNAGTPKLLDWQDSFVFSEVFKYAYLIFADEGQDYHVQRNGRHGWVFNTEGHLIRARCTMPEDLSRLGSCSGIN